LLRTCRDGAHERVTGGYGLPRECSAPKLAALENRSMIIFSQDEPIAAAPAIECPYAARGFNGNAYGAGALPNACLLHERLWGRTAWPRTGLLCSSADYAACFLLRAG
jgi:hypothetical protein